MTPAPIPPRELWDSNLFGNSRKIAEILRFHGSLTRAEIIAESRLSRPTVVAGLAELARLGLVREAPTNASGGGRPASLVCLSRSAGLAVGLDVGRRHLRLAISDLGHHILAEREIPLDDAEEQPFDVLDHAATLTRDVLAELDATTNDVVGTCLGLPAPITNTGAIGSPTLLPAWAPLHPQDELSARLGTPVIINNDANLGALAEHRWGAGAGCETLVYLKLGTGVGAGIILNGQLYRGTSGTAGELGHLTLDAQGPVCRCGNRGCMELSAGGRGLVALARSTHPDLVDVSDLLHRAGDGDLGCRRLLADAGTQVGIALGGLVNLLNPERIILGGELAAGLPVLLEPLRRGLANTGMAAAVAALDVVPAALGARASALGGLTAVMRDI